MTTDRRSCYRHKHNTSDFSLFSPCFSLEEKNTEFILRAAWNTYGVQCHSKKLTDKKKHMRRQQDEGQGVWESQHECL